MKFIHLALSLGFVLCNASCSIRYSSKTEAYKICEQWLSGEESISFERELVGFEKITKFEAENPRPDAAFWDDEIIDWEKQKAAYASQSITETMTISSRYCMHDPKLKRFIGYENKAIRDGTYEHLSEKKGDWETMKSFRY